MNNNSINKLILALYVDDGLIVAKNKREIDVLLMQLQREFNVKIGDLSLFLGIQVERMQNGCIFFHQKQYADKILQQFKMESI